MQEIERLQSRVRGLQTQVEEEMRAREEAELAAERARQEQERTRGLTHKATGRAAEQVRIFFCVVNSSQPVHTCIGIFQTCIVETCAARCVHPN